MNKSPQSATNDVDNFYIIIVGIVTFHSLSVKDSSFHTVLSSPLGKQAGLLLQFSTACFFVANEKAVGSRLFLCLDRCE